MPSKIIANPTQIAKIIVEYKEHADYFYVNRIPEKRVFFGLFKWEDEVPAGWFSFRHYLGGSGKIKTKLLEDVLAKDNRLYYSEKENKIYYKPNIEIIYSSGKEEDKIYYDSAEELDEFITNLKTEFDVDFVTIYKNDY